MAPPNRSLTADLGLLIASDAIGHFHRPYLFRGVICMCSATFRVPYRKPLQGPSAL